MNHYHSLFATSGEENQWKTYQLSKNMLLWILSMWQVNSLKMMDHLKKIIRQIDEQEVTKDAEIDLQEEEMVKCINGRCRNVYTEG